MHPLLILFLTISIKTPSHTSLWDPNSQIPLNNENREYLLYSLSSTHTPIKENSLKILLQTSTQHQTTLCIPEEQQSCPEALTLDQPLLGSQYIYTEGYIYTAQSSTMPGELRYRHQYRCVTLLSNLNSSFNY